MFVRYGSGLEIGCNNNGKLAIIKENQHKLKNKDKSKQMFGIRSFIGMNFSFLFFFFLRKRKNGFFY